MIAATKNLFRQLVRMAREKREAARLAGRPIDDVFDEIFERMWHFYLEYSRAGFTSGYLDVQQITLARPSEGEAR